ncbi:MAG: hypothetical protein HY432_02160 [Candidatus Liptonbacteria bacterium]|nr:hypothetical protein [Candidatus Liptonbacteria bacterium]
MPTPSIVVLGHKDHGKSTFLGRLLFETNSVPADKVQTIKEIDAEAGRPFEWAHLLDSFKEEREQEMTYDTASVFVNGRDGALYVFIDVPGHSELVHQMISGASRADMAILMVSAKEGIDEMSVGHLMLAEFLGLEKLIVAVNKMDEFGYEEAAFSGIKEKVEKILVGKFSAEDVHYIPLSAREGENITKASSKMQWYEGSSVFEKTEEIIGGMKPVSLPLRAVVQDVYIRAGNRIAAVSVKSGEMKRGEKIVALPSGKVFAADKLLSVSGDETQSVKAGENAGIFAEKEWEISRGTIIAPENNRPNFAKDADSEIFLFENFKPNEAATVECGSLNASQGLIPSAAPNKIQKLKLNLSSPVLFDKEETFLNKFVIKQGGDIIGVGRIKDF